MADSPATPSSSSASKDKSKVPSSPPPAGSSQAPCSPPTSNISALRQHRSEDEATSTGIPFTPNLKQRRRNKITVKLPVPEAPGHEHSEKTTNTEKINKRESPKPQSSPVGAPTGRHTQTENFTNLENVDEPESSWQGASRNASTSTPTTQQEAWAEELRNQELERRNSMRTDQKLTALRLLLDLGPQKGWWEADGTIHRMLAPFIWLIDLIWYHIITPRIWVISNLVAKLNLEGATQLLNLFIAIWHLVYAVLVLIINIFPYLKLGLGWVGMKVWQNRPAIWAAIKKALLFLWNNKGAITSLLTLGYFIHFYIHFLPWYDPWNNYPSRQIPLLSPLPRPIPSLISTLFLLPAWKAGLYHSTAVTNLISFSQLTNLSTVLSSPTFSYSSLEQLSTECIDLSTWLNSTSKRRNRPESVQYLQNLFEDVPPVIDAYLEFKREIVKELQDNITTYRNRVHTQDYFLNNKRRYKYPRLFQRWQGELKYLQGSNTLLHEILEKTIDGIGVLDAKLGHLQRLVNEIGTWLVFIRYSQYSRSWRGDKHAEDYYENLMNGTSTLEDGFEYVVKGMGRLGTELTVADTGTRVRRWRIGAREAMKRREDYRARGVEREWYSWERAREGFGWLDKEAWEEEVEEQMQNALRLGVKLMEEGARLEGRSGKGLRVE